MTPAEGVRAHIDLQCAQPGGVMLPIHWGTFNLAPHPWAEPGEGTVAAAAEAGARLALPKPGEPCEPTAESVPGQPWWRSVATAPTGGWATAPGGSTAAGTDRDESAGTGSPEVAPTG